MNTHNTLNLTIAFSSYWRAGSGEASGNLDDTNVRDSGLGLPLFPGRQLKGIIKDAVALAASIGWLNTDNSSSKNSKNAKGNNIAAELNNDQNIATTLFGTDGKDGVLRVDNAIMQCADIAAFQQYPDAISGLFHQKASNSIDHQSGCTNDGGLRFEELVVPMCLTADISLFDGKTTHINWQKVVRDSLPLIRSIGANRSRGLGKVSINAHSITEGE